MHTSIVLVLLVVLNTIVSAQYLHPQNARSIALSGAMVAVPDAGSGNFNTGALAAYSLPGIEMNYQNRYTLPELGTQFFSMSLKAGKGIVSPQLAYFGSAAYNQTNLSLAYSHQLAEWFFAGVHLIGASQSIQATGERVFGVTADVGLFAKFIKGFACGIQISSPGSKIANFENVLVQNFGCNIGASYEKTEQFLLTSQLNWEEHVPLSLSGGVEVFPHRNLALRAGFKLPSSASYSFGLGLYQRRWRLNIGFEQHQILGLSASISLLINFIKNAD